MPTSLSRLRLGPAGGIRWHGDLEVRPRWGYDLAGGTQALEGASQTENAGSIFVARSHPTPQVRTPFGDSHVSPRIVLDDVRATDVPQRAIGRCALSATQAESGGRHEEKSSIVSRRVVGLTPL